ncbi:preprotein translocase subunit SecG [Guggenheimella bovis]
MTTLYWIFVALIVISGLVLIGSVLMQSGKAAGLSGAIGGGAEQLFGKQKGRSLDSVFERLTLISAIVFMISAVALTVLHKIVF